MLTNLPPLIELLLIVLLALVVCLFIGGVMAMQDRNDK